MRGDFTRWTFRQQEHYHGVLKQQGRVDLDSDWNEQGAITSHLIETEALDVIGQAGAPQGDAGFMIQAVDDGTKKGVNLSVSTGRAYVDGILCENDGQNVLVAAQPAIKGFNVQPDLPGFQLPTAAGTYIAYLEVWERHITFLDDSEILEVALGGPDTCTRAKTVWQVNLLPVPVSTNGTSGTPITCSTDVSDYDTLIAPSSGTLQAQAQPTATTDPCMVPATAGYRSLDNQLYRVEIHNKGTGDAVAGSGTATFKWSRDNGSVVASWIAPPSGQNPGPNTLFIATAPKDAALGFAAGQWIELSDDTLELNFQPGVLVQLTNVQGQVLTVDPTTVIPSGGSLKLSDYPLNPKIRRWDSAGRTPVTTGSFLNLENGIQVQFGTGIYDTGDYWLIPARTLTANIDWPVDGSGNPLAEPPRGIHRHYCRLAVVQFDGKAWSVTGSSCLATFPPLTTVLSVEHEGKLVGIRNTLNFTGPGVTAVTDNPAAQRIDIQITGGGASGESSPTLLLFPYCKVDGSKTTTNIDTLIAISSTTASPFGPPQPSGSVTLFCFGTGLSSSPLMIPPTTLAAGQMTSFSMLSKLLNSGFTGGTFEGYVIADCAFAGAYGFAEVSRIQGPQTLVLTGSYLAIVLPRPPQLAISTLTPATATALVGGTGVQFTITLTANAPTITVVQISTSPSGVANIPSTATVAAGSASTTFTATPANPGTVTITVTLAGATGSAAATFTVQPIGVSSINAPIGMADGEKATGTVLLNGPAPSGATVLLASDDTSILQVDPKQVVVPQGTTTSPAFNITATNTGPKIVKASITAEFPPGTKVGHLINVGSGQPPPPPPPPPGGGKPQ